MSTITKERLKELAAGQSGLNLRIATPEESMELARIALASLEAEPVAVNDDMAYAFHHALSDSPLGADEVEEIKAGLRAAFANVTAPPAPVSVPDESAVESLATDLMKRIDKITGERHSVATLSSLRVSIVESCRAAMFQGKESERV